MKNIDLTNLSFEDLIKLQKNVNETIVKKRKGNIGDIFREIKSLSKKRTSLSLKIDELETLIIHEKLKPLLRKHFDTIRCFLNSDFSLVIYFPKNDNYELTIDIEAMQVVKSKEFTDDEINIILNIVNDVINGEAVEIDATDILLKKPYEYQLELFEALESDILMSDEELDEIVEKFDLDGVDLQRFVTEFKYNENGAKNEE